MSTETEIVAYSATKAALVDLEARYRKVVYDVTTAKGMSEAKSAKKEIMAHRITLEAARVKEKAESLAYGKRIDAEARPLRERIEALENPITEMIETETKREQREREAAIEAEKARIAAEEQAKRDAEAKAMADRVIIQWEEALERRQKLPESTAPPLDGQPA